MIQYRLSLGGDNQRSPERRSAWSLPCPPTPKGESVSLGFFIGLKMQKRISRQSHVHEQNHPLTDFGCSKFSVFENVYEVSEYGIIRKVVNKFHKERNGYALIKWSYDKDGYAYVKINNKKWLIHRLVYKLFISELQINLVVCHLDGNKTNNHFSNLLQTTQAINISHKKMHGTWQEGEKHPKATITNELARKIKNLVDLARRSNCGKLAKGEPARIAKLSGATIAQVYGISSGKSYKGVL